MNAIEKNRKAALNELLKSAENLVNLLKAADEHSKFITNILDAVNDVQRLSYHYSQWSKIS